MRGVVRPAIAVLLLVGVGMASAAHARIGTCGDVCAIADAGDDEARVGNLTAVLPDTATIARTIQPPCDVRWIGSATPPSPTDPLIDAPKTSPPA